MSHQDVFYQFPLSLLQLDVAAEDLVQHVVAWCLVDLGNKLLGDVEEKDLTRYRNHLAGKEELPGDFEDSEPDHNLPPGKTVARVRAATLTTRDCQSPG